MICLMQTVVEREVVWCLTLMLHRLVVGGRLLVLRHHGWRRARWLSPILNPFAELLHLCASCQSL